HYDPALNLSFWGTGNGAPWMGDMRPGDNLYSSSVLALDVDTGKIRAHHQYHWNDSWDWDEVSTPLLIDFPKDGRTVKGLVHPGQREPLQHAGGAAKARSLRARQALPGHRASKDLDELAPGRQSHRRAAGVGHEDRPAGLDSQVPLPELGAYPHHRRWPRVPRRYQRS